LTALTQLRSFRSLRPLPGGSSCWASPLSRAAVFRRGVFDRERDRRKRPLTLPVAPRRTRRAEAQRLLRGTRTASTTSASTLAAFPAQSAFHRRVLNRPLSRPPSPPPIARLCRRAPASDAASPPRCSRAGGLDSNHGFPWRALASHAEAGASHAPLVDFCNPGRPASTTSNRPNPAHHPSGRPDEQL